MPRHTDPLTTALGAMLVVGALLACKKRTPTDAAPSAVAAESAAPNSSAPAVVALPSAATSATASAAPANEVKRYAGKEKVQTGAARIVENGVKVFSEADEKTAELATLDKDLLVFRLASIPDWELVEFPSGLGKLSPGWVQAQFIDTKPGAEVPRDAVVQQSKPATAKSAGSAAPKASASAASAKSTPGASTSAKTASSAKPAASVTAVNSAQLAKAAQAASAAAAKAAAAVRKATSTKP